MHSSDYCHSCGRDEPVPPSGAYRICLECGHVFVTVQDLLDAYDEELGEQLSSPVTDPDRFGFCPHCLHDF